MPLRKIVTGDSSQMSKRNSKKFVYVNQQNAKKHAWKKSCGWGAGIYLSEGRFSCSSLEEAS